ncbi:MAG: redox-sensing transcriptional repressor Rex [Planctomycetes bacterium]|nr:redox-sensing transcriptional repressor Rex [Planctomycetota bacterium]
MRYHKIPDETIRRLPIYLRGLQFLLAQPRERISSRELAEFIGTNPWQIRKDFSYFGDFGTPGVGYGIEKLITHIKRILKLDVIHKTALIGAGNLGTAVMAYQGFKVYGFDIVAAFDSSTKKIGKKINNIVIEDISNLSSLKRRKINLAVLAIPRESAQETADKLVKAGIKGILNFSPCYITVPKKIKIITIDIAMDLARMPYYMTTS